MRKNVGIGRTLGHIRLSRRPEMVGPREIGRLPPTDRVRDHLHRIPRASRSSALRRMAYRGPSPVPLEGRRHGSVFPSAIHPGPNEARVQRRPIEPPLTTSALRLDSRPARGRPCPPPATPYAEEVKPDAPSTSSSRANVYALPNGDFQAAAPAHSQPRRRGRIPPQDIFQGDNGLGRPDIDGRRRASFRELRAGRGMISSSTAWRSARWPTSPLRDRRMLLPPTDSSSSVR